MHQIYQCLRPLLLYVYLTAPLMAKKSICSSKMVICISFFIYLMVWNLTNAREAILFQQSDPSYLKVVLTKEKSTMIEIQS